MNKTENSMVSEKLRQVAEITNPLDLVSRGLLSGRVGVESSIQALKGLSVLIEQQCAEIIRKNNGSNNNGIIDDFAEEDEGIGHHYYVEVSVEELNREVFIVGTATGGIDVIVDRLEQNRISIEEAAHAISGLAILIRHKCAQIIEQE